MKSMYERFIKRLFSTTYLKFDDYNGKEQYNLGGIFVMWLIGIGVFIYGFYPAFTSKDISGIFLGLWIFTIGLVMYNNTIIHALLRKQSTKVE